MVHARAFGPLVAAAALLLNVACQTAAPTQPETRPAADAATDAGGSPAEVTDAARVRHKADQLEEQGRKCDADDCGHGLICRDGGRDYRQCLRPADEPFDFLSCHLASLPRLDDAAADCDTFVADNQEPKAEGCPAAPTNSDGRSCKQVIIGRFLHTGAYIGCVDDYIVLNRSDWTQEINDRFVHCTATGAVRATCDDAIRLVSGHKYVQDSGSTGSPVTARELCQFHLLGCRIEDWGFDQAGWIVCPEPDS